MTTEIENPMIEGDPMPDTLENVLACDLFDELPGDVKIAAWEKFVDGLKEGHWMDAFTAAAEKQERGWPRGSDVGGRVVSDWLAVINATVDTHEEELIQNRKRTA